MGAVRQSVILRSGDGVILELVHRRQRRVQRLDPIDFGREVLKRQWCAPKFPKQAWLA
jgi:hypothetical protein